MQPIYWWIIAVVVVLVIIWLVARAMSGRRAEQHREQAAEIRTDAQQHDRDFRERQAKADEADAQARRAQAEADEANAKARQLQTEAERRGESAEEVRSERDDRLRHADSLDPDVETDKDGNRVGTGAAGNRAAYGDRDADGDVGLDDRLENRADSSVGRDNPHHNDLGDGHDDATWDGDDRRSGDRLRGTADDVRGKRDTDGDGHRG